MRHRPTYPTDFNTYDDLLKDAYGDFNEIAIETPLIEGTIISKRLCKLFPKVASIQIQQLQVSAEDNLIKTLGQSFSEMIVPYEFHKELYKIATKEEMIPFSAKFHLILNRGYTDITPYAPRETFSKSFLEGYQKLAMPFTYRPIHPSLIEEIKQAFSELENQILDFTGSSYQVHPADVFVYKLREIAEEYYRDKLADMLTVYPIFQDGKGACMSEWGQVMKIKWCEVIQGYIRTIEEPQYKRESELQNLLSEKAISLETFMTLDIETALALQDEAEQRYKQSLEEKQQTKTMAMKHAKLIPWMRGEENLQSLWKKLDDCEYIEHEEFQHFLSGHFQLVDKPTGNIQTAVTQKIIWKSTTVNLIAMIQALHHNNIISVKPFNKKTNTEIVGRIRNLIHSHFCRPNNKEITLDAIRQASHRMTPDMGIDYGFNTTVLKCIRSMH